MRTLLILLVLMLLWPVIVSAQDAKALAKDKAAAETVFWQVHQTLIIWPNAGEEDRAKLVKLQQICSKQVTVTIITPSRNGNRYRFKTEKHIYSQTKFSGLIQHEINRINRWVKAGRPLPWADPISSTPDQIIGWLEDYAAISDENKPKRISINEWVIKSGTMPPLPKDKTIYCNRIKLIRENGQWKLSELQIYLGRQAWFVETIEKSETEKDRKILMALGKLWVKQDNEKSQKAGLPYKFYLRSVVISSSGKWASINEEGKGIEGGARIYKKNPKTKTWGLIAEGNEFYELIENGTIPKKEAKEIRID